MELSMSKPRMRKACPAGNWFICSSVMRRSVGRFSRRTSVIATGDTPEQAYENWKWFSEDRRLAYSQVAQ